MTTMFGVILESKRVANVCYIAAALVVGSTTQSDCGQVKKCNDNGPAIRFPFALTEQCAYPGFQLHCNQKNETVMELHFPTKENSKSRLPYSIQFLVKYISYEFQLMEVSPLNVCVPARLLQILDLSSVSPFQFNNHDNYYTLLNCSKMERKYKDSLLPLPCLSSRDYDVYAVRSDKSPSAVPLYSCSKMIDTPLISADLLYHELPILLNWSRPDCGRCETAGYGCRLKNHTEIECYTNKSAPPVEVAVGSTTQSDCGQVEKCKDNGPAIQSPFSLKEQCAYPGFQLHCNQNNDTIFELSASTKDFGLPYSIQFSVKNIYYEYQSMEISPPDDCLLGPLQILDSSASPFQFYLDDSFTLMSLIYCSKILEQNSDLFPVPCLSGVDYHIYAVRSYSFQLYDDSNYFYHSCSKMFDIPSIPAFIFDPDLTFHLSWSIPECRDCEAAGKYCRFKNHTSISNHTEIECYTEDASSWLDQECTQCEAETNKPQGPLPKLRVAGEVLGPLLAVSLAIASYWVYNSNKLKKESELKIEQFLVDYKALKPTRYSYADIKKISNNFCEKLGEGGYGIVYKGKLSNDVFVAIKVLINSKGDGEEFINEVSTIGRIHHVNVVRLVGYCADGFRRALVYEFMPNDSLQKFVSSDRQRTLLGWERLHRIAIDIAKGIEYLHQGCEQRILHFDIKPNNILLDDNFHPKIADFGLAKLCSKEQSKVSMTVARGTIGYIAPEVFSRNFGNVSYKSDVYSFGMLLLEMIGGLKKDEAGGQDKSEVYFPEWIYNKLDQGEEITIQIEKEGDDEIVRRLTIVGLWCIQWYPVGRPSMKAVIKMLESEEIPSMPRNPFTSTGETRTSASAFGRMFSSELEVISESE